MDHKDLFRGLFQPSDEPEKLISVSVGREGFNTGHFSIHLVGFAEDLHRSLPSEDLSSQCVFSLETHEKDSVAFIFDIILEMMKNAAGFGHA